MEKTKWERPTFRSLMLKVKMKNNQVTIISIDTGDPKVPESTTAFVRITFNGVTVERKAMVYSGSFASQKERIINRCLNTDFIVLEKIDSTNKYLSRSVIEEQVSLMNFLKEQMGNKCNIRELIRSGRKEVITDKLLKKINLWEEGPYKTHHHDIREATRNGLYFMAKDEELNNILSNYVQHFFF